MPRAGDAATHTSPYMSRLAANAQAVQYNWNQYIFLFTITNCVFVCGIQMISVTFAVSAGLPMGKEGPMIHNGAIVASGVSQKGIRFCSSKVRVGVFCHR